MVSLSNIYFLVKTRLHPRNTSSLYILVPVMPPTALPTMSQSTSRVQLLKFGPNQLLHGLKSTCGRLPHNVVLVRSDEDLQAIERGICTCHQIGNRREVHPVLDVWKVGDRLYADVELPELAGAVNMKVASRRGDVIWHQELEEESAARERRQESGEGGGVVLGLFPASDVEGPVVFAVAQVHAPVPTYTRPKQSKISDASLRMALDVRSHFGSPDVLRNCWGGSR